MDNSLIILAAFLVWYYRRGTRYNNTEPIRKALTLGYDKIYKVCHGIG